MYCEMKGEPGSAGTIVLVNEHLTRRTCCRFLRLDLQVTIFAMFKVSYTMKFFHVTERHLFCHFFSCGTLTIWRVGMGIIVWFSTTSALSLRGGFARFFLCFLILKLVLVNVSFLLLYAHFTLFRCPSVDTFRLTFSSTPVSIISITNELNNINIIKVLLHFLTEVVSHFHIFMLS